ncbi:Cobalt-zinc-cadmium resistance protein czcC precursor (Cation efflux system protein czcC) [Herminiimonas arsenicoxydans]|uniref:Cobalt-zinc-cadmium resistance protein czcC (Cation efflux system protein czcC) n=1 Tax=Herminiimonas arsenicoxydans TaxID=204773 RepID=A4G5H1_HERAR|nr:Cobalt-zinc-cadmium resistance protein czcC precursor (Cation efflux system protein czcC) [Herminiimonas arsenicoxydans]
MQKVLLPLLIAASTLSTIALSASAQPMSHTSAYSNMATQSTPAGSAYSRLTLAAALELAYNANPDIAVARREVEAIEGTVQQAGLIPNPELATLVEDTKRETRTTTVQINQVIELGGKRGARISAAERGRDFALMDLTAKQADIRAKVISAFYDVLVGQERIRLAEGSVELAKRATLIASRRVMSGKISPVEETRARVAEAGVRVELAQAVNELETARRQLAATWGGVTPGFELVENTESDLPTLWPLPELAQRLQQSPFLLRAKIEVERRKAIAQVERSRRIPDVTVTLGAKRDEQMGRNQAVIGLSIPIPVFDRNQGNVLESLRRTDKARDELVATEVNLNMELGQAHGRLSKSLIEAELIKTEILPGAQSNYDATTKGFELGKFSFLEVLDAQRTFFQAKSQYLRSLAETYRAATDIDRLLGEPFSAIK